MFAGSRGYYYYYYYYCYYYFFHVRTVHRYEQYNKHTHQQGPTNICSHITYELITPMYHNWLF